MLSSSRVRLARLCAVTLPLATAAAVAIPITGASAAAQSIRLVGTANPVTGAFTPSGEGAPEFPEQESEDTPDAYGGVITDRSLSTGHGHGVSVQSGTKAKSNPTLGASFEGLNLYQQRYARGGNQFTVEPPDQALCVGNGFVVE